MVLNNVNHCGVCSRCRLPLALDLPRSSMWPRPGPPTIFLPPQHRKHPQGHFPESPSFRLSTMHWNQPIPPVNGAPQSTLSCSECLDCLLKLSPDSASLLVRGSRVWGESMRVRGSLSMFSFQHIWRLVAARWEFLLWTTLSYVGRSWWTSTRRGRVVVLVANDVFDMEGASGLLR